MTTISLFLLLFAADSVGPVVSELRKAVETGYYDQRLTGLDWNSLKLQEGMSAAALYSELNRVLSVLKDGHTSVVPPSAVRNRKAASRFGLGFEARFLDGKLAVMGVQSGSPVEATGIKRGWVLQAVNSSLVPADEKEFEKWIRDLGVGSLCEAGKVELSFLNLQGAAQDHRVACAMIREEPVRTARMQGNTLITAFDRFDAASVEWFNKVLEDNPAASSMVLDLRANFGGERSALLKIADRLLEKKVVVGRSVARRGKVTEWKAGGVKPFSGRIVVLVDSATMSAGEILAATLQENGRARVLGRKTGGSVLLMRRIALPDGGELRLSVEDFAMASGRRLEKNGVDPDEVLKLGLADLKPGLDADLARAMALLP